MTRARGWFANGLILVAIGGFGWYSHDQATRAEDALCALRQNLETRVAASEQYLADVEAGRRKPVPGITETDITTSIRNQRETIGALSGLDCPPL